MTTFAKCAAQGDVRLVLVGALPAEAIECAPVDGKLVLAHSETGHDHVMVLDRNVATEPNVCMYTGDNPLLAWIKVNRPTALVHKRGFDTHAPIVVQPGIYEIRRQREYVPEGFRQVQD